MLRRLAAGDKIETAASFAYRTLAARKKNLELHVFPGVLHGYMMPGNPRAFSAPTRKFSLERARAILGGLREQPVRKAS